jgi:hypothetical protein
MMRFSPFFIGMSFIATVGVSPPVLADDQVWKITAGGSAVRIHVGKSGLFSAAGHTHEVIAPAVSGIVRFDPERPEHASIELTFDAKG